MTTEDPPDYKVTAKDIAEFYRDVHNLQTRKRNPLTLEVRELAGKPNIQIRCDVCEQPPISAPAEPTQHDPLRNHGPYLTTGGNSEGI